MLSTTQNVCQTVRFLVCNSSLNTLAFIVCLFNNELIDYETNF